MKLLTVLIRLFEPENEKIVTRHLGTIVITELTAGSIFSSLEETLSKSMYHLINYKNLHLILVMS